jgi:deoxycytidylate deaminase
MEHLIKEAWKYFDREKKYNLVAFLLDKKGEVLSVGVNKHKTHPYQAECAARAGDDERVFLHAEVDAIIKYRGEEIPYSILVLRLKKDGTLGLARPCDVCQIAIQEAGIQIIQYSTGK